MQFALSFQVVPNVCQFDAVILEKLVEREPRNAEEFPKLGFRPEPLPQSRESKSFAGHTGRFRPQPAREFFRNFQGDGHRFILISA